MPTTRALILSALLGLASAQGLAGKTEDNHPEIDTYTCNKRNGCTKNKGYIVLDSSMHRIYQKNNPTQGCGNWGSGPDPAVCPDEETCNKNCLLEAITDYSALGVTTDGDKLHLDMLRDSDLSSISPRVYLLDESKRNYDMIKLTGKEFSFDVDVSKLPCGMNGALYLSEMDKHGGQSKLNKVKAKFGGGYCDAQCYTFPFRDGVGNIEAKGACCPEMDIWEANRMSTALVPHPCNITKNYGCTGEECEWTGVCDEWGCAHNPYGGGNTQFYGPGSQYALDTRKPFTVVTKFHANKAKELISIERLYVQEGREIPHPVPVLPHLLPEDHITDEYCETTGGATRYLALGGTKEMGAALSRGMVLAMSIWWDEGGHMQWLDGGNSGPCNPTEGAPSNIRVIQPDVSLTFSKIKWGDIGTTY